jgi:3-dehydro-L-gulonate 2-dehydrogenase
MLLSWEDLSIKILTTLYFFDMTENMLIPAAQMHTVFRSILVQHGFSDEKADAIAEIFTTNSLDGVYSHGVNRFTSFVKMVKDGHVIAAKEPFLVHATPSLEQWNGALGPGMLNARMATDRVVELAKKSGIGCVALANTNHWMRGGYYGWQAARKGVVFIGWSNTIGNMPAYGAIDTRLGNNPVVISLPYEEDAIVLDMAMSQFSYGAMEAATLKGEELPVYGGYDQEGKLTKDPSAVLQTRRMLSIGYWKGAGLSLLLDIVGTIVSGGLATHQISKQGVEKGLSQVFIGIDTMQLHNFKGIDACLQTILEDYKQSVAETEVLFPGERVVRRREENSVTGIPVVKKVWEKIIALMEG